MRRHENDTLVREVDVLQQLVLECEIILHRVMQRIDDRIARDEDGLFRHVFRKQVRFARRRRREVQVCDAARELAVHFLRER